MRTPLPNLPPDVAEKFELVEWRGGARQVFGRFGTVDLTTITVQRADRLVRQGFKRLRRRPEPEPTPEPLPEVSVPTPAADESKKKK